MFHYLDFFFIFTQTVIRYNLPIFIKIFSLFLLLTYSSYVFKIILPLVIYAYDYNYIVNELCEEKNNPVNNCFGTCQLTKLIQKQLTSDKDESVIVQIDYLKIPHFTQSPILIIDCSASVKHIAYHIEKELIYSKKPHIPPPKMKI